MQTGADFLLPICNSLNRTALFDNGIVTTDGATISARPRGSGGPDLETFECLAPGSPLSRSCENSGICCLGTRRFCCGDTKVLSCRGRLKGFQQRRHSEDV